MHQVLVKGRQPTSEQGHKWTCATTALQAESALVVSVEMPQHLNFRTLLHAAESQCKPSKVSPMHSASQSQCKPSQDHRFNAQPEHITCYLENTQLPKPRWSSWALAVDGPSLAWCRTRYRMRVDARLCVAVRLTESIANTSGQQQEHLTFGGVRFLSCPNGQVCAFKTKLRAFKAPAGGRPPNLGNECRCGYPELLETVRKFKRLVLKLKPASSPVWSAQLYKILGGITACYKLCMFAYQRS